MKHGTAFLLLLVCLASIAQPEPSHSLHFFHDINKSAITEEWLNKELHAAGLDTPYMLLQDVRVQITGYTDCPGSTDYNQRLSERRAGAAADLFPNSKFPEWTITSEGRGEEGCNAHDLAYNDQLRRTDIILSWNPPVLLKEEPEEKIIPVETAATAPALSQITELEEGQTIVLHGLNFIGGRHFPVNSAYPVLDSLVRIMKANPTLEIEIQGHICCSPAMGDGLDFDTGEEKLSVNRAYFVYSHLVKSGIDKSRLSYKGFAYSRPLFNPETTVEQQDANRRVEAMVVKK